MNYVYTYGFIDTETGDGVSIERACKCIEACAGMDDPAAEIERLREERNKLLEALIMAAAVMTACDAPEIAQRQVREVIEKLKQTNL